MASIAGAFCRPTVHQPFERNYHVPGKDASVKCFDAVQGTVHLLCEVHRCAKKARCCILAFILSFCVCGLFSKILHFGYLTLRRKTPRESPRFRQARKLLITACGGMAKSARCCPRRPIFFVNLFFHALCCLSTVSTQFSIMQSCYAWKRSKMTTSWCSGCHLHGLVENDSLVLLENDTLCCDMSYTRALISSQFS